MVDKYTLNMLTLLLHTWEDVPKLSLVSVPTNDLQDPWVL